MKHKLSLDAHGQRRLPLYNSEPMRRAADLEMLQRSGGREPPMRRQAGVLDAPLLPGRR